MSKFEKIAAKEKQVEKLLAEIETLKAEAANEVDPATILAGVSVDFNYGRAENKKSLTGTVVGVKAQEKGPALVKVRVGEGFDEQTYSVFAAAVTKVHAAE